MLQEEFLCQARRRNARTFRAGALCRMEKNTAEKLVATRDAET
jgi:hypothetical protein